MKWLTLLDDGDDSFRIFYRYFAAFRIQVEWGAIVGGFVDYHQHAFLGKLVYGYLHGAVGHHLVNQQAVVYIYTDVLSGKAFR